MGEANTRKNLITARDGEAEAVQMNQLEEGLSLTQTLSTRGGEEKDRRKSCRARLLIKTWIIRFEFALRAGTSSETHAECGNFTHYSVAYVKIVDFRG